jgi:CRISPR-associated endonuclease Csn1
MKKILGLDLGTNSIGWAVINADEKKRENETTFLQPVGISSAGSRIIPMSADILGDFDKGNSVSQTKERTTLIGTQLTTQRALATDFKNNGIPSGSLFKSNRQLREIHQPC